jgi:hypothetical protein
LEKRRVSMASANPKGALSPHQSALEVR